MFHGILQNLRRGISSRCSPADILDEDEFWENELLAVNHDRLFGCYSLDISVNGFEVNGMVFSILFSRYSSHTCIQVSSQV